MFLPTKSYVKLANENMAHVQVMDIILCHFTNCPIIYPVVTVYYYPGNPSNAISYYYLKFYLGFQNITSKHLEYCDFIYPQGSSWRSRYQTGKTLYYLQIKKKSNSNLEETNILWFHLSVVSKMEYLTVYL